MIIYKGKKAVCGIQLTIDNVWRYAMQNTDSLKVRITDGEKHVVEKTYTHEDVDPDDKMIQVDLDESETASLAAGNAILTAYMNDMNVISPQNILIKEAL